MLVRDVQERAHHGKGTGLWKETRTNRKPFDLSKRISYITNSLCFVIFEILVSLEEAEVVIVQPFVKAEDGFLELISKAPQYLRHRTYSDRSNVTKPRTNCSDIHGTNRRSTEQLSCKVIFDILGEFSSQAFLIRTKGAGLERSRSHDDKRMEWRDNVEKACRRGA